MLTEQRHNAILELVNRQGSVTVAELKNSLGISESTARRDIVTLDKMGKLEKVFGGAMALKEDVSTFEPTVAQKADLKTDEKAQIAEYAAGLIEPNDFVFIDSGTTTLALTECIATDESVIYVTNGVMHAHTLSAKGNNVILIGGKLKNVTEAVVGDAAIMMVQQFQFTKGFFGVNGISRRAGFTTPEYSEGLFKQEAMNRCKTCYVLGDSSKFGITNSVKFGNVPDAVIITDDIPEDYRSLKNIISVK